MSQGAAVVERRLRERLVVTHIEVTDQSALHAGHAGATGGGHYAVTIVSPAFAGLSAVARHRLVYRALGGEVGRSIHALALATFTPEEWPHGPRSSGGEADPTGNHRS